MRHLLTILAALLLCSAPLHAQTLKSLMYNSTNGQVVANTGTNVLSFSAGSGVSIANSDNDVNLTVNESGLTFATVAAGTILFLPTDDTVQLGGYWNDPSVRASLGFSTNLNTLWTATNSSNARSAVGLGATWLTNTNVANVRTDIGLPLPALTNTSNVTMMRALSGSTNTNHPYSGTVALTNTNAVLTFSNGILQSVQ